MSDDVRPLGDQAYGRLFDLIRECVLLPGERISERAVAVELGMGLAPVRAALARLTAEGIVLPKARVGYEVRGFTPGDVDDFFEAWAFVAPRLVGEAIGRADADTMELLQHTLERTRDEAAVMDGPSGWVHVAEVMFDTIVGTVGNPFLERFYDLLHFDMHRLFVLALREGGVDHAEFDDDYAWVFRGDVEVAVGFVESFIARSAARIRSVVEQFAAAPSV